MVKSNEHFFLADFFGQEDVCLRKHGGTCNPDGAGHAFYREGQNMSVIETKEADSAVFSFVVRSVTEERFYGTAFFLFLQAVVLHKPFSVAADSSRKTAAGDFWQSGSGIPDNGIINPSETVAARSHVKRIKCDGEMSEAVHFVCSFWARKSYHSKRSKSVPSTAALSSCSSG